MPPIEPINPIDYPAWDDLLISCPGHTFFHSSAWAKVLHEAYQYTPSYFTVFDNGQLLALMPVMEVNSFLTGKRGVSLPFTDYTDAIITDRFSFMKLFDRITEYGENHGWRSIEFRGGQNLPPLTQTSSSYLRHVLHLSENAGEIFSRFRASVKRNIRSAIKNGVKVEICRTLDSIKEFDQLNHITRKRHGIPPQPFYFFKKVYEHIISRNLGFVVLASYRGNAIAGAVFFHFGKGAFFKYGASDESFFHLRANNLVMWEAIRWYSENGYESISFGRTEPGNEGLRRFKASWGSEEWIERYYKYDFKKNEFTGESRGIRKSCHPVFRKMPLPLLRAIGFLFYKHVG